jgi:hypothetical protein
MTEKPFSHGTAANVSGANEQNGFHPKSSGVNLRLVCQIVNGEMAAKAKSAVIDSVFKTKFKGIFLDRISRRDSRRFQS